MNQITQAWCSVEGCNKLIDINDYYNHMDTHSMIELLDGNDQIDNYNYMTYDYQFEELFPEIVNDSFDEMFIGDDYNGL